MDLPCPETTCKLHDTSKQVTNCRNWDGITFDLALLGSDRPSACPFMHDILRPIIGRIVERSRGKLAGDELLSSVAVRVLEATSGRRTTALPVSEPALSRFVQTVWLDEVRRDLGRMRCTSCAHYLRAQHARGTCGLQTTRLGEPHAHYGRILEVHAEPRQLVPKCTEFSDARRIHYFAHDRLAQVRIEKSVLDAPDNVARLESALAELLREEPELGALVMSAKLEGWSCQELAHRRRMTAREVDGLLQQGLDRLRKILDDQP